MRDRWGVCVCGGGYDKIEKDGGECSCWELGRSIEAARSGGLGGAGAECLKLRTFEVA